MLMFLSLWWETPAIFSDDLNLSVQQSRVYPSSVQDSPLDEKSKSFTSFYSLIKKMKYHTDINTETFCNDTWFTSVPFLWIIWDVSTPQLQSTCGKFNLTADSAYQGKKKKKKSSNEIEETAGRAHRQDYVKTQIWAKLQKLSAALNKPQSAAASITAEVCNDQDSSLKRSAGQTVWSGESG